MTTKPNFNHCFEPVAHEPHFWTGGHCSGQGINPDGYVKPLDPATSKEQNADSEKSDTQELLDGRRETYGDVVWNAERVAKMWNGYLGIDLITPADMMMMMALYKAYRFKITPDYSDNINDVLGYAEIVRTVQRETGGLIDAETVKEYQEKKARKADLLGEIHEQILNLIEDTAKPDRSFPMSSVQTVIPVPETDASEGAIIDSWAKRTGNPYANLGENED